MSWPALYRLLTTHTLWLRRGDAPNKAYRDLRSGVCYPSIDAVPDEPVDAGLPAPRVDDGWVWVGFSVSVQHRADETTQLGQAGQILWQQVTGTVPTCWGWHEPCLEPWSTTAYTGSARTLMPYGTMVLSGADRYPAQAVTVARRNRFGVEDTVSGLAVVGPVGLVDMADIGQRAVAALREVAAALPTPSIGTVSVTRGGPDISFATPMCAAPVMPLAVIVGPRAMRALGADAVGFAAEHGGQAVGWGKFPSLVMPLFGTGKGMWGRLAGLVGQFSPDRLATALFLPRPDTVKEGAGHAA
jgi:hypothetical protein